MSDETTKPKPKSVMIPHPRFRLVFTDHGDAIQGEAFLGDDRLAVVEYPHLVGLLTLNANGEQRRNSLAYEAQKELDRRELEAQAKKGEKA